MKRLGRPRLLPLVVIALLIGAVLRLAWPNDIHFLGDEAWTFRHVTSGTWESLGMPSSRGLKNAGMSVWVFIVLGKLGGASTPSGLTRCVAVLALVAHALLLVVPLRLVADEKERRVWLWTVILALTNPILVFLERKIWAQSVLPIFMTGIVIAWMRRSTKGGAFAWGVLGALIGQIHMAGFFFTPALALWTRVFSRAKRTSWIAWFAGSFVGALPSITWLLYLAHDRPPATGSPWWLRFRLEFYQYFVSDPFSLSGEYVVGDDIWRALKWPIAFGHPTYLLLLAHGILAATAVVFAVRALAILWERRRNLRSFVSHQDDTSLLLGAVLLGMGVLMTLPSISIHRHYMLATFPLQYVLVSRVALHAPGGEKWLRVLAAGGAVVSFCLLLFVHDVGENAEMGKTYATQLRLGITPEEAKPEGHP